jgi:hypothetical protein
MQDWFSIDPYQKKESIPELLSIVHAANTTFDCGSWGTEVFILKPEKTADQEALAELLTEAGYVFTSTSL